MAVYLERVSTSEIVVHRAKSYTVKTLVLADFNCDTIMIDTEDGDISIKLFIDRKYLPEGTNNVS